MLFDSLDEVPDSGVTTSPHTVPCKPGSDDPIGDASINIVFGPCVDDCGRLPHAGANACRNFVCLLRYLMCVQGVTESAPEVDTFLSAYFAADGNPKELRRWQRRLAGPPESDVTLRMSLEGMHVEWVEQDSGPQQELTH